MHSPFIDFDYSDIACEKKAGELFSKITEYAQLVPTDTLYLIYFGAQKPSLMAKEPELATLLAAKPSSPIVGWERPITAPDVIALDINNDNDKAILRLSIVQGLREMKPGSVLEGDIAYIYGWIWSPLSADTLANQLGFIAIQESAKGDELLHYTDPLILSRLRHLMIPVQRQDLFLPSSYWLWLDGDGELVCEKNESRRRKHLGPQLGIVDEQWDEIYRIMTCNRALARYREERLHEPRHNEAWCNEIIDRAIREALKLGYREDDDLEEFAYLALSISPEFFKHERVRRQLSQSSEGMLSNRLRGVSKPEWAQIKQDCDKGTKANKGAHP